MNKRIFTLVELLVVIATLTNLLRPAINNAKERTKMANQRQSGVGFAMYANDNNDVVTFSTNF
jgi:competence protein ComGC